MNLLRGRRKRVIALAAAVALLVSGAGWQAVATARDRAQFPPPGEMVAIGEREIHVVVGGDEHPSGPTVILEAGATSFSVQWAWVLPEVSRFARVIAYDRPGLGWSEEVTGDHDAERLAVNLEETLDRLDLPGPYILVAHSFGSFVSRIFAARNPDDIAGVVLVDATHPDQFDGDDPPVIPFQIATILSRVGVLRLIDLTAGQGQGLPADDRQAARAAFATTRHLRAVTAEGKAWSESAQQAVDAGGLGDIPLVVVSANSMHQTLPRWPDHQKDLALLSNNSEHVTVEDATHESIVTDPEHAQVVVEALQSLVQISEG